MSVQYILRTTKSSGPAARARKKKIFQYLQEIKDYIECLLSEGENLDNDKVRRVIHKIVHKDKLPHITEVIKPTLNGFIREYIRDIESGARQTGSHTTP